MDSGDRIIELARALARAIQTDGRYIELSEARAANDADEALQEAIGRYNLARIRLRAAQKDGDGGQDDKSAAITDEAESAYREIMAFAGMERYEKAQREIERLSGWVSAVIAAAFAGDDPDSARPPSSCTGRCGGCSGCR
jgi:cell fate (sporulation/competence/biofilm development) regulator YlbF (YheA/YmcA/DUF963 family)